MMDGIIRSDVKKKVDDIAKPTSPWSYDLLLRLIGVVFTLVAAIVAGVNHETEVVSVSIVKTLPPLHIPVTAKWYYTTSAVYFVVSNCIACSYAAASLVFSIIITKTKPTTASMTMPFLVLDLVVTALLFSANGATAGVGIIGMRGNSHLKWRKVCGVMKTFCEHSTVSFVMSITGSFVFLCLVLLPILTLHRKSS